MQKNKKKVIGKKFRIFSTIVIAIIFLLGFYELINYNNTQNYISKSMESDGHYSLFLIVFILEFLPQVISPDYSLLLAIGLGMNLYLAVMTTMIASVLGSAMGFLVGYHYGFETIAPFFEEKKLNKIIKVWNKHGKWFVLAAGVVPLPIPYFPIIFGALRMNLKTFLLWGIIPRTLGFIATGIFAYYGFHVFFGLA